MALIFAAVAFCALAAFAVAVAFWTEQERQALQKKMLKAAKEEATQKVLRR